MEPRSRRIVVAVALVFVTAALVALSAPGTSVRTLGPRPFLNPPPDGRSHHEVLVAASRRLAAIDGRLDGTLQQAVAIDRVVEATVRLEPPADPAGARELARRAAEIKEALFGPDDPRVADSLAAEAMLLCRLENYAAARAPAERALGIREKSLPPGHPQIGQSFYQIAEILRMTGDYAGAIRMHTQAVPILSRHPSFDPLGAASSLNYLGVVHAALGDHRQARACLEKSLDLKERITGPFSETVASGLTQLGVLAWHEGNPDEAMGLFRRARRIWEMKAPGSARMAHTLAKEGLLLAEQGRHAEARPLLQRALDIRRSTFGPDHYLVARSHVDLARLAAKTGDRPEAERLFQAAIAIQERDPVARADEIVDTYVRYARFAQEGGEPRRAMDLAVRAESLARDIFLRTAPGLTEPQALRLEAARQSGLGVAISALQASTGGAGVETGEPARQVWDQIVRSRGMVLDVMIGRTRGGAYRAGSIGLDDVSETMPAGSAMIAYIRYEHEDPAGSVHPSYVAAVMTHGTRAPVLVHLGPASEIEAEVRAWRAEAGTDPRGGDDDGEGRYRRAGRRLRALIWDPVIARAGVPRLVFVVPDGLLGLVSFASLPDEEDRYLIESPLRIHYLSAERSLVRSAPPAGSHSVLAVGGVAYDAGRPIEPGSLEGMMAPACPLFDAVRFSPLPGTAREAEAVARLWRPHAEVSTLMGESATETAFMRRAPGRTVLHLATHGYFLEQGCGSSLQTPGLDEALDPAGSNPLRMAGLVFAGANRRARRPPGQDDGILTAEEIGRLDLSTVRWAILSACETGAGLPADGEGVLGLRRGFEAAGAGTLIASMWPVEDAAARIWMGHFHQDLVAGRPTVEAVREAGLRTLQEQRRLGRGGHPGTWGAFLASGDWR